MLLLVGVGGFFGAILRAVITQICFKILPQTLPFGTLFVNVMGGFLIGVFMTLSDKFVINSELRSLLVTGFLGALTTFSTFAYENILLLQSGNFTSFGLNVILNVSLSVLACYAGVLIANL
ncbi:fluoride efflux transporter CrcB [Campylobacter geochelonis]|uniref:fluoride efflux transporter CrcB n=1 Tax=Campylobacter geochelonis TaxID=1780362 RepID=UPI0007709041|nr:fluoride efflux transporter CrcB [Campylobacter geochelonis]CZE45769.1 CrcB protein [Campylobacter geochelonis]CZE49877.1 CrcB protein [Campylobacter geochelonis]